MTRVMLGQFCLAVVAIILTLNVLAYVFITMMAPHSHAGFFAWMTHEGWVVTAVTLAVIVAGSLHRASQLKRGAGYMAVLAGALPVTPGGNDPLVRRLLNVTEEMSIASGVPLPKIFIIPHERAINAFVTGMRMEDTALVVTQGALETLSRDELQGVIGHEYSHIMHNDMRLNGRIIMLLGGIMMLSTLGRMLMQRRSPSRSFFSTRSGKHENSAALFGAALFVVGYAGVFAGRLIQAAISRQREFHSDAASVQFTRNPAAIAGALHRILMASEQSYLKSTHLAQELNHMCFSESLSLNRWFASHPPLDQRIAAVDPLFKTRARIRSNQDRQQATGDVNKKVIRNGNEFVTAARSPLRVSQSVGEWQNPQPNWAKNMRETLSLRFHLDSIATNEILDLLGKLISGDPAFCNSLPEDLRFPLLELLTGRLKQAQEALPVQYFTTLQQVAKTGKGLASFCYMAYLEHHLLPGPRIDKRLNDYSRVRKETGMLLSLFARMDTGDAAEAVFQRIAAQWFPLDPLQFVPAVTASGLREALAQLNRLSPLLKPALLDSWAEAVSNDGHILTAEYDLLRVAATMLECPMPPAIPLR